MLCAGVNCHHEMLQIPRFVLKMKRIEFALLSYILKFFWLAFEEISLKTGLLQKALLPENLDLHQ